MRLETQYAQLEKELRELKTRLNLIDWIEHELKEHPDALKALLEQIAQTKDKSEN